MLFAMPIAYASVEDEAAQAVDLFYDLQFDRAIAAMHALEARHPDSPVGPFYLSVAYYQRYLLEDPPGVRTIRLFESSSDEALRKAVKLMPSAPAVSHYYQGAALGFQARAYVAQHRYVMAIPKARQAVTHLNKALELDPALEDANLGLGLYNYFLDRIPQAAKPVAYLMVGMWGDRDKGLTLLKEVALKGHAARWEAQSILAAIDASQREQKWDEALPLFQQLMERYPHNPRYRIKLIYVLQRKGLWETAAQIADPDGTWVQALDPIIKERAQSVARYRAAENLLFSGRWPEAVTQLDRLESEDVPGRLADWVALRRGNALDAQGRPADAAAYYSLIRDKKARGLAEIFLKTPFPSGPRDVMPGRWPLSNVPVE